MKLKYLTMIMLAGAMVAGSGVAQAKKMSDLKIYINPGHGGYTSNDRPIQIYPFAPNDSAGYWESKSNLYKGLHMYHILDSLGAKPYLSRIKNTEDDDRSLSGIAAEANQLGVDLFFSIHSNAGETVNYPLMLYRENTIGTPRYPENVTLSKLLWKNLYSNQLPVWTRHTEYIEGDLTFYQNMWQGGLGVLRTLYVVGLLSEGGMHEHRPEAHRLMNDDYWWLEAWHFVRTIMEFYDTEDRFVTGNVAGIVYDDHNLQEFVKPADNYTRHGRDRNAPLNGVLVELLDQQGKVVQKRTTDNMYNGVFVFRNVAPGNYKLRTTDDKYYTRTEDVTVVANEVTYRDMPLNLKREAPLAVVSHSPAPADGESVSCASTIDLQFNTDIDEESFKQAVTITPEVEGYWEFSESFHKARFVTAKSFDPNVTYTVTIGTGARTPDKTYATPNLPEPFTFSFTTLNRSRMELMSQFPQDGGTIHYTSPTVEFRFDKTIDPANLYDVISVRDSKGNKVAVNKRGTKTNQLSNGYGNAVVALQGSLTVGETYSVTLGGELRDREKLPLGDDVKFTFKAIDAAAEAPEGAKVIYDFDKACDWAYDVENTVGIANVKPTSIRSTGTKLFGSAAGKFGYQFSEKHGGEIVWNYTGEAIQFNTGDKLGMYINGDFNNHELWVGVSSGTNKKYTKVCDLDFLGWQYREVSLDNLESDFCPFILSDIKLVQKESPITQKGSFALDNLTYRASSGVNDIVIDENDAVSVIGLDGYVAVSGARPDEVIRVIAVDGRVVAAGLGSQTLRVAAGVYVVTVGSKSYKVTVK